MPLIVTTTTPDPVPVRVVSLDGRLRATADTDHGGVLLRADYSTTWGISDNFNANVSGWAPIDSAAVSRTTSSPLSGSGSLLWTRQDPVNSTIVRTLPAFPQQTYEQKVVVYFTAKTTAAVPVTLSIGWSGSAYAGTLTTDPRPFYATIYVPPNTTPDPQMTFFTEGDGTTNVVLDNVTVELQPPTAVYMFRNGKPLRGSFPAAAADGIAYGYDYESTFGEATTWTCQPEWTVRDALVTGPVGGGVGLVLPDLNPTGQNMSLKSLNQPNLSRKVIGKWPAATRSWEGRNNVSANPGASLSSGSWDVPVSQAETWVMETTTRQEAADLETLLKSGPLLVQHAQINRRADQFALVTSFSSDYKRGPIWPELLWTVALLPIATPTSVGAAIYIPGRSYADLEALGTYANVLSSFATYDAILSPVTTEVGSGFGTAAYGTVPFGT